MAIDPKYEAFKEGLITKALKHYIQPREEIVGAYFFKGKCAAWAKAMADEFPELALKVGFYGHNEHYWCELGDGTIIDPTIEQFYEPAWNGNPALYKYFDESKDEIYLGKCMNCGEEIHGLKAQGRQDICPPEEGEELSECAQSMMDYYNRG